jgi:type 1 fimbria pilin
MLIAVASAQVYTYMYLGGSITIVSQKIVWIHEGTQISGDTVNMSFSVQPGLTSIVNYTLYLKNLDSSPHNMTITVTDSVSASDFEICNIYIYDNSTSTLVDILNAKTLNDEYSTYTGNNPLGANAVYRFDFEIRANTGAANDNFEIRVKYE